MGVVYLARRLGTSQPCALKVILPEVAAGELAMRRFLREVSVLSRLEHPRIVKFHEMDVAGGQFFFAMEYVETVDLEQVLSAYPEATRTQALCGLACHALEGLAHAHARGFVHRDVKPSNLLVSASGHRLRVKLADFGLAKKFESSGLSAMTHEGQVVGTIAFMAPEQVASARRAQPGCDVYSLGATLYYLLARQHPYDFFSRKDNLAVILEDPPIPLAERRPGVPAGLSAVLLRSLAKDPRDRFASAEDFRQALLPYARRVPGDRP
jgi:serine/threonine-protein kinase